MRYSGQAAIDYLSTEATKSDPAESSHWRKFHSEFRFTGKGFAGLQGFGGNGKSHTGLRKVLHKMFQGRFRKMGRDFPEFEAIDNLAEKITAKQGRGYDLDVLRQALTLAFLRYKVPHKLSKTASACVIGDGFASMTSLLLASGYAGNVYLVNLTKTLLVDLWYLKLWMGYEAFETSVNLVTDVDALEAARIRGGVVAVQASDHELLQRCPVDIAINIASMQEMDPPAINAYFDDLRAVSDRQHIVFYCCNREEKTLPDGTITRFSDYPWSDSDQIILDELCPWHQRYYSIKPPFYHLYDGPIRHRLLELG